MEVSSAGLTAWIAVACLSLFIACSSAQSDPGWTLIHKQTTTAKGSTSQPAIRYGHTCAAYQGQLVTSHGYFYDRQLHSVNWLSDTWLMSMKPPYKMQLLSAGITQEAALAAYRAGQHPPAPCGRFGHTSTLLNHTMYMYGGHDGGYSRTGRDNYEQGHDFEELWSWDFEDKRWSLIKPSTSVSPGRRYLAAMASVGDELIMYGGMNEGQGDVWAFNVTSREWQLLAHEATGEHGPGRRVGHSLTPVQFPHSVARGVILYGGRVVKEDGTTHLAEDTWYFDLDQLAWRKLEVDSKSAAPPRTYHAAAHTYIPIDRTVNELKHEVGVLVGLVTGGTTTTPQLSCTSEAWAFVVDCGVTAITWKRLPDMPVAVYDTRAAADPTALYAFGGHLCAPQEGFPYYYTNMVARLPLKPHIDQLIYHGCQIDRKQLVREAPHAHGGTHDEL